MRREEGWSSRRPGRWPVWPELSEQTGLQGQQGGARPLGVRQRGAHNAEHMDGGRAAAPRACQGAEGRGAACGPREL